MRGHSTALWAVWVLAVFGRQGAAVPAGGAAEEARAILAAAGGHRAMIVHLDCGDGGLTAELGRGRDVIVLGLAGDAGKVEKARARAAAEGLAGQVSFDVCDLKTLPLADAIVNLVVAEDFARLAAGGLSVGEVLRAVCPGGVALLGGVAPADLEGKVAPAVGKVEAAGGRVRITKAAPDGIDQWPTLMHGPDGNPVSTDRLAGPPNSVRWIAARPTYPTNHRKASNIALVTGAGRVYTICPELTDGGRGRKTCLTARDAHNGLMLWKAPLPDTQARLTKPFGLVSSYRTQHPWPLIADGEALYTITGAAAVAIDGATGKVLRTYSPKGYIDQMLLADGRLVMASPSQVFCLAADTGREHWKADVAAVDAVVEGGFVYMLDARPNPYDVVKLDLATGAERLRVSIAAFTDIKKVARDEQAITLIFCKGGSIILARTSGYKSADKLSQTFAISAEDGRARWKHAGATMHGYLTHHFFHQGLIWIESGKHLNMVWEALDPATGEVRKKLDLKTYPLNKCQRSTATERYYVNGRDISMIDWTTGAVETFGGARGSCRLGMTPANGMFYSNPVSCGCGNSWVRGYLAMAAGPVPKPTLKDADRLVKGPAFPEGPNPQSAIRNPQSADWPCWRGNPRRTMTTDQQVPTDLKVLWEAKVADRPAHFVAADREGDFVTAPAVAGGIAVVADTDRHRVCAFDPADGKSLWSFTASGRIDSTPTIHQGKCIFGTAAGWVYCLRAADGGLIWRFFAAPADRRIPAWGQLESIWPVPGSVMVEGGAAVVAAGRSSHSDGGITACGLDPATGKLLWKAPLPALSRAERMGHQGLNDAMISDGQRVWLHATSLAPRTGQPQRYAGHPDPKKPRLHHNKVGLTAGIWRYYDAPNRGAQASLADGRTAAPGKGGRLRVLAIDPDVTYAFAFGEDNGTGRPAAGTAVLFRQGFDPDGKPVDPSWSVKVPDAGRYSVLLRAGEVLFCAGLKDRFDPAKAFLEARSVADGKVLAEIALPHAPTSDGLAVAAGRLYLTTRDGRLVCLGGEK